MNFSFNAVYIFKFAEVWCRLAVQRFHPTLAEIPTLFTSTLSVILALGLIPFSVANAATTTSANWVTYGCNGCHGLNVNTVSGNTMAVANAADAGNVVSYMSITRGMGNQPTSVSPAPVMTPAIASDIAIWISQNVTTTATSISAAYNTTATGVITNIYTTGALVDEINVASPVIAPSKGTVVFVKGAAAGTPDTITYTPTAGACGADSFTYQGSNNAASGIGTTSLRTVAVTIANPTAPTITAGQTGTGTFNVAMTPLTVAQTSTQSATLCGATNFSATSVPYSATATGYTTSTAAYPAGVTLSSAGVISVALTTAAGTYTLPVFAINPGGASAAGSVTITINPAIPAITVNPVTLVAGTTATLSATSPSAGAITYSTATAASICTVSGTTVTGVGVGTCAVTASQAAAGNYGAATSAAPNITVGQGAQTIQFAAAPTNIVVNPVASTGTAVSATAVSVANAAITTGSTLTYSAAAGTGNCTVNTTTGAVTGTAAGTCTITATQLGTNLNYVTATPVSLPVTVGAGPQSVSFPATLPTISTGINLPFLATSYVGSPATTTPTGLAITYSTVSTACSVNATTGAITGITKGNCAILATPAVSANYIATTTTQVFSVGLAAQSITFATAPASVIYSPSNLATGSVSATASSLLPVSYSVVTGGTGSCTVNAASGAVVGTAAGTCIVAANQAGDATVWAAAGQQTQTITVGVASQTISFSGAAPTNIVVNPVAASGTAVSATTTATGLAVTYGITTGGTGTCSVNAASGAVTGISAGTCIITANQAGSANYSAAAQVTQTVTIGKGNQAITFGAAPSMVLGGATGAVSATANISGTTTASGLAVTYSSTTPAICTVAATTLGATVSAVGAGGCIIAANQSGDANYNAATQATLTINIGQGVQSITFAAAPAVSVGTTGQLSATATTGLAVSYSSTTPAICSVSGSVVTGLATGICTIAADQTGNANFSAAPQVTQSITIGKGSQKITFGTAPALKVGRSAAVSATSTSGLAVTYSSLTSNVCSISGNTVTAIVAGTCTVAADQTGDANYNAAPQVTQSITVVNLPPTVAAAMMTAQLNTTAIFDLAPYITGVGITGVSISAQPNHGSVSVSGSKLTYTPNKDYFGTDQLAYMAFGSGGSSANSATVTITITGRPDPTKDARVTGLINSQTAAVMHIGTTQLFNFKNRLESRHHAVYNPLPAESPADAIKPEPIPDAVKPDPVKPESANPEAVNPEPAKPEPAITGVVLTDSVKTEPVNPEIVKPESAEPDADKSKTLPPDTVEPGAVKPQILNFALINSAAANLPELTGGVMPGRNLSYFNSWQPGAVLSYANDPNSLLHAPDALSNGQPVAGNPMVAMLMGVVTGLVTNSSLNLATISNAVGAAQDDSFGRLDVWAAGNLRFGSSTQIGMNTQFATDGVTVGVDKRVDRKLTVGMGMGYARDNSTIGTDGTNSKASGNSVAGYASYQMDSGTFLDGLLGFGKVNFDTNRYVAAVNDFARAARKGDQIFGSLAFGYEYRNEGLLWSPYGRYDFSYDRLNAGAEAGAGANALSYASQNMHSSSLGLGMRAQSAHHTEYGLVQPHVRAEYLYGSQTVGQTAVAYADLLGTQYSVTGTTQNTNSIVLGLGSDFLFSDTLKLGVDYQHLGSKGAENFQSVNFMLTKTLDGKNDLKSLLEDSYASSIDKPTGLMVAAGYAYDDNVSRASEALDKLSDTVYSLTLSKSYQKVLAKRHRMTISGFLDIEKFRTYAGLDHVSGGLNAEYAFRSSSDFGEPVYGIFARFTGDNYASMLRDGSRRSVGVNLRESLTDKINLFAALTNNARTGKSDVFRTHDNSLRMNLDYALAADMTLYATGEYRKGDIVSSGQPSLKTLDMSTVFVRDDVFISPTFYDYRLKGKTTLFTLGYNCSFGPKDSLDLAWRRANSTPDMAPAYAAPTSYIDNQFSISYLMAF